jgi:uncharacterized protein (DUF58 family)
MFGWRRRDQRIRFRLRAQGQVFIVITLLVMLAAVNTGANLLYIVVGGLLSFLIISRVLGSWSLRALRISRECPEAVHRDQQFLVTLRLENHKRLLPCMSLRITTAAAPQESAGYILKIPAQRAAVLRISECFPRRGVHLLPSVAVITTFPLGLFEARVTVSDERRIVVYPRVVTARIGLLDRTNGYGETPRMMRGDGDEFFALREYMPGDDIRKINWRASARAGSLIVKQLEPDTSRFIVLLLDTRWSDTIEEFDDRFEEAVETIASLAVTLLNRQFKVAITSHSGYVPLGEGTGQILKVLDFLARVSPTTDPMAHVAEVSEGQRASIACVSPDPGMWGRASAEFGAPVVNPREVVHA